MGLGDADLLDDGDGGGGKAESEVVSCSICLEGVIDNVARSWAKLQCGHQFHLDCIGSAFNIKGAMQCPNCRNIEKGQWLYASGSRPLPEYSMDDWSHDEDIYDLSYYEMSFGVHWCPFAGLTPLPSSFDEGEFSSSAYHDLGRHAISAEHTVVSSMAHPCPYIAYFGPIHPSSTPTGIISDGSNFNNQWSAQSVPGEIPSSYAFPAMDVHYHGWEHHTSPFATSSRTGGADQSLMPSVTQRTARTSSEIPRPGSIMHPLFVGHSSGTRTPSSTSSMVPPYPVSVARARDRVPALHGYFQQPSTSPAVSTPLIPTSRRSNSHGGLPQVAPVASPSDQSGGFYYLSSGSSGRTVQDTQNPVPNRLHSWDREHLPSFSLSQVDRDPVWVPFHPAGSGSDTRFRSGSFRQRHGSERMPSQNRS